MASSARNQGKTCPEESSVIPLALWQKRGAPDRQKGCQCGWNPVREGKVLVERSCDKEFGFYSKCSGEPEEVWNQGSVMI